MNAETKILTPAQCLEAMRPALFKMLDDVQVMLEGYPMDSFTRGQLALIRASLRITLGV